MGATNTLPDTRQKDSDRDNIFMTVDGIKGEVIQTDFKDTIAVKSFGFSTDLPITMDKVRGGATTAKANASTISITKVMDLSSVKLWQQCCEGKKLANVKFQFIRFSQGKLVVSREIVIEEVFVTHFEHMSDYPGDSDLPMERIKFAFGKLKDTYTQQKPDGTMAGNVSFAYDFTNAAPA